MVEALLATKEGNPRLSVQLVIREARKSPEVPPELSLPSSTGRRRFAFAQAGELWMRDVMHGPSVLVGDRTRRKIYLIAFIDDATRLISHAAFALSENTATGWFMRSTPSGLVVVGILGGPFELRSAGAAGETNLQTPALHRNAWRRMQALVHEPRLAVAHAPADMSPVG